MRNPGFRAKLVSTSLRPPCVRPGVGRAALERTKVRRRHRTWLLALCHFFTGLSLSFTYGENGLQFLFLRDAPFAGSLSLAVATPLWCVDFVIVRRLRVGGS